MTDKKSKSKSQEGVVVRLQAPAAKLLVAVQNHLETQSGGDSVTQGEIVHHALRLLATALDPALCPDPSAADLLSSAVTRQLPGTNEGNR